MENNPQDPLQPEDSLLADDGLRQIELEELKASIKKARNMLYVVAVLVFIGEMVSMATENIGFSWIVLGVALFEAAIFIALALWTHKKPYQAVVGGLIAFIGIILFSVFANGYAYGIEGVLKGLVSGIIIKVAVLVALFRALSTARRLQNFNDRPF